MFLNCLGREYDPITMVIQSSLTKFPAPAFGDVVFEVQGFDAKLQSYEDTSVSPNIAFNIQQNTTPSYNIIVGWKIRLIQRMKRLFHQGTWLYSASNPVWKSGGTSNMSNMWTCWTHSSEMIQNTQFEPEHVPECPSLSFLILDMYVLWK